MSYPLGHPHNRELGQMRRVAQRVLMAMLDLSRESTPRSITVRRIAKHLGWRSHSYIQDGIVLLRATGLVKSEYGTTGTLRLNCTLELTPKESE